MGNTSQQASTFDDLPAPGALASEVAWGPAPETLLAAALAPWDPALGPVPASALAALAASLAGGSNASGGEAGRGEGRGRGRDCWPGVCRAFTNP